ncbi:MAG: squalene--hopene cyclase [Solirubrobacteraceae bacterium]
MSSPIVEARSGAEVTLERACEHLVSLQSEAGWWKAELETNVTMDAEDMFLREFLGIRNALDTERSAAWIRSQQRDDATWGNFDGADGDLSTTIEAYWALRLAGDSPEQEHMRRAAAYIRLSGGIEKARVFTHVWMALFGLWSWDQVPALPPEIMLMPSWAPLNIYDFACWARQTVVALSIVMTYRPIHELPFTLAELRGPEPWSPPLPNTRQEAWLARLEAPLRLYGRHPFKPLRRLALGRAERWIVRRQEKDGSWGGIQPPWVYSLMALRLRGYPLEHPVLQRGLQGIDAFMIEDEDGSRRMEACQSPVWDTALSLIALADAGHPEDHDAMRRGADWLLGEEVRVRGDWAVRRPHLDPGGWAFEFANANYPDIDDTTEVVLALRRTPGSDTERTRAAIERASRWVQGMQSKGGGWGAFDADNTRTLIRMLAFLDFGEVIDGPSSDVTAHAIEMLAELGLADGAVAKAGVRWLIGQQERDGSWYGRWGVNYVYGTGAAVPALVAAGVSPQAPCVRRAVAWLYQHQNDDGGWGEDARSYDDPKWIGRGPSTASQTAWALLALNAAGEDGAQLWRGIDWLVATQNVDGGWDEPQYTGTGFPSYFYINYHLYRITFPIMALGRCLRSRAR